ncbi:diguanylate cyclase [Thiomicrorhabdus sp. ZW0627]|uniref:transporter substrate-binding domain-containing diguanylate cyclase n=1 Tax=Thiomicrorhabdus sp. ZW0627 TaxID=3039774 RepID=UPI002436BD86|nr:diguanylate cyclase [Thiomicrorhabdus sp. ZW0627]MDG6773770.1 diguanylate cyclase [Thiomicrorhabdus sp. ZW0627]
MRPLSNFSKFLVLSLLCLNWSVSFAVQTDAKNPTPEKSSNLEKVSLQLKWLHQFQFAGYYAAKIKGFYADEGLDVEIRQRDIHRNNIEQVISGEADYSIADSILLLYQARKQPVVIVAPIFQHSPQVFISLKSSGIDSPYKLDGKNVAFYKNDADGFALESMLAEIGVKPKYKRVMITADPEMLSRGEVVAYPGYLSNEPYYLKRHGYEINLIRPMNYGIDLYGDMLFTSQREVTEHPDRVERFRRATIRGWQYAMTHKKEIAKYIQKELNSNKTLDHLLYEADVIEEMMVFKSIPIGTMDEGRLQFIQNLFKKHGLIDKTFPLSEGVYRPQKTSTTFSRKEMEWILHHPVVKVAIDSAWEPIEFVDKKGHFSGISAGYLNYLSQSTGITFQPAKNLSWSEAVHKMKTGELDMYSAVVKTADRTQYTNYTEPYLKFPMVIATQRGEPFIADMAKLKGKTVAAVKDYASHEKLNRLYPEIPLLLVDTAQDGIEAVSKGKAYAYVDNVAAISHIIKTQHFTNIQISGETPFRADLAMAVRKDWPELQSILQKTLNSMDEETRNHLTDPWLQVAYKKEIEWKAFASILGPIILILIIISLYTRRLSQLNRDLVCTQHDLTESNQKLETLSTTDHLTGIFNRSHLDQVLTNESQRSNRHRYPLSMILIDLDDFKKINDTYGHLTGDDILIQSSEWIQSSIRETDTFGRWGGEEFLIICPDTTLDQATVLAEKIRQGIAEQLFTENIKQTLSIGVSQYKSYEPINKWISRTDEALYKAKHQGKNQVVSCLQLLPE